MDKPTLAVTRIAVIFLTLLLIIRSTAQPAVQLNLNTTTPATPELNVTSGVQLGGAVIDSEGHWSGTWQATPSHGKTLDLKVPPASALLVKIELRIKP